MFDIGFFELLLIGVVTLLVVGPERLPKLARTAGLWMGKARSMVSQVKADIDRELAAEELKKTLAKQAQLPGMHDIIEETRSAVDELERLDTGSGSKSEPDTEEKHENRPKTATETDDAPR